MKFLKINIPGHLAELVRARGAVADVKLLPCDVVGAAVIVSADNGNTWSGGTAAIVSLSSNTSVSSSDGG